MSVCNVVLIDDQQLPEMAEWQKALDEAGGGITLDYIADLRVHTGYLPATYRETESGFEWYYGPISDTLEEKPRNIGNRSHAVSFVTHSDLRELACAMVAGAVLAQLADGLVLDEESGEYVNGGRALKIAREIEAKYL